MKLIIIRHADPDYAHDSLTEVGFAEAEALSERIKKMNISAFYVSPLGRARATAKPILEKMGKSAEILDWLQEFPIRVNGKPEAPSSACCWDWIPSAWTQNPDFFDKDRWYCEKIFQDAGVRDAYTAVCDSLDALLEKHGYRREGNCYRALSANEDTVVLICHFGIQCILLSHLLNISPMLLWHGFCAAPSSVTTLVTEERREGVAYFRMGQFGDISHLYAKGAEPSFAARFREAYYREDQRRD